MFDMLLFDIDDTLLDFHKAEHLAFKEVCEQYNITYNDEFYKQYGNINAFCWKQLELGKMKREEVYIQRFEQLFDLYKLNINAKEFNDAYFAKLRLQHSLMPNAIELLEKLSNKKLYVVTNGDKYVQEPRYHDSGLHKYFNKAFVSQEVGYEKPSIEYFNAIIKEIPNFNKETTLIIGDSLTSDIKGGNNIGIKTCWYNPKRKTCIEGIHVDYEIHDLLELLPIVNQ
ncbi:MAG: YjjG family noncanonical pyrimidine nucleotidase [Erysipelotrichaceae bacterium]|nr:YjjG family noncanonical pyrimidine nucleotidase [Erysipelotrichaceae bacterium]